MGNLGSAALRRTRPVALLLLALLVLGWPVLGWPPPAAGAVGARSIDRVCAGSETTTPTFSDAGAAHGAAVQCAADHGLVGGFPDGSYGPGEPLTRGQMATVLRRLIEAATAVRLPVPTTDPFPDIAGSHRDAIAALHAAAVVAGRADGRFDPGATVTRGQMARFLVKALDRVVDPDTAGSFPPPATDRPFDDIAGTSFEADILALAAQGVVQGTSTGTYAPATAVSRGQVATFVMRTADLLAAQGIWDAHLEPLEPHPSRFTVVLTGEAVMGVDASGRYVSDQGQPGATATATLAFEPDQDTLTFVVNYGELRGPFDAAAGVRLQRGETATNGSTVLVLATGAQLQAAADEDPEQHLGGVLQGRDAVGSELTAVLRELRADPDGFYLTVRSNEYSGGAVRGQFGAAG